jgi:Ca2+:H+ antiporter
MITRPGDHRDLLGGSRVAATAPPASHRPWHWTVSVPVAAAVLLVATWGRDLPAALVAVVAVFLGGAVLAAVHHAEVVAHRVGEPFGSLVLAVAVTVIEVALIVTLMAGGGDKTATLARDTVFAAVMITCNGVVGLALVVAALRRRVAVFNAEGTGGAFATVTTLATLSLVLPSFTTGRSTPEFTSPQLSFAAVASGSSSPCRPSGTATTSCRSLPAGGSWTSRSTPRRPPTGRR